MSKIAILTTHRANNFGAMLQCYSLVNAFRESGIDAWVLDWRCPELEWLFHDPFRMVHNPIRGLKRFVDYMGRERPARLRFAEFRSLLPLTRKITRRNDLEKIECEFDGFVVGSDQVWNPLLSASSAEMFDRSYILDFVTTKPKYSYAASIGVKEIEPKHVEEEFVRAWRAFDIITTREFEAAAYIARVADVPAVPVLDPVLLHDATWWDKILVRPKERRYVLVYNVRSSDQLEDYARKLAKDLDAEIISFLSPGIRIRKFGKVVSVGPREFVGYIANAEAVVTNSFHASAFSTIFGKHLHVEQKNQADSPNTRFSSLMRFSNLHPMKTVANGVWKVEAFDCSAADYLLLQNEREKSLSWIRKMNGGS